MPEIEFWTSDEDSTPSTGDSIKRFLISCKIQLSKVNYWDVLIYKTQTKLPVTESHEKKILKNDTIMPVEINKKLTNREKKSINQKKKISRDPLQIQSPENHPIKRLNSNPNEKQCKMKRKKKKKIHKRLSGIKVSVFFYKPITKPRVPSLVNTKQIKNHNLTKSTPSPSF